MERALDEESEEYTMEKKHDSKGSWPMNGRGGRSVQIVWKSEDVIGRQTNHAYTSMASENT